MAEIDPRLKEQGAEAEARFQAWVDDSRLPYVYADQTRETVPVHYRRAMKRPDFLVALPYVGTLALDVKAKSIYGPDEDPYLIFDVSEVCRLATFARLFRITAFFACLSVDGSPASMWFRLEDLMLTIGRRQAGTVRAHLRGGIPVSMACPFHPTRRDQPQLSLLRLARNAGCRRTATGLSPTCYLRGNWPEISGVDIFDIFDRYPTDLLYIYPTGFEGPAPAL